MVLTIMGFNSNIGDLLPVCEGWTMKKEYRVIRRTPTLAEYKAICSAVGWADVMNFEAADGSLKNSLFGVVVQHQNEIVGMGRIVGDGCVYFYIQDIAVIPEHQSQGVGRLIMGAITGYLEKNAPEKSFVGLFSAEGKETFYRKYGFQNHQGMTGMFGVIREGEIK